MARWVLQRVSCAIRKPAEPLSVPTYSAVWSTGPHQSSAVLPTVPPYQQGPAVLPVIRTPTQPEAHAVLWNGSPRQPL